MSKWRYRKREPSTERGICVRCERMPQRSKPNNKWDCLCANCRNEIAPSYERYRYLRHRRYPNAYRKPYHKLIERKTCIRCGFIPEDVCQLDVDHIDGNHKNNEITNLQVLCANCHRLKTLAEMNANRLE